LETAQDELKHDMNDERAKEHKQLELNKELVDLEQLELNIQMGKRLIKQKRFQLGLIENDLLANEQSNIEKHSQANSSSSLSSSVSDDLLLDNSLSKLDNKPSMEQLLSNEHLNPSELLGKLKAFYSEANRKELDKLKPIIKKLPKLNEKLRITFENIDSSSVFGRNELSKANKNQQEFNDSLEKKWSKYLRQNEKNEIYLEMKKFRKQDLLDTWSSATSNGANANKWQTNPAYKKLMYDSGRKLLEEKWNYYLGNKTNLVSDKPTSNKTKLDSHTKPKSSYFLNTLSQTTANVAPNELTKSFTIMSMSLSKTLPASTQRTLNEHQKWLNRFKSEYQF
jgi:hypothetical protein